jgi:hypothetical protein
VLLKMSCTTIGAAVAAATEAAILRWHLGQVPTLHEVTCCCVLAAAAAAAVAAAAAAAVAAAVAAGAVGLQGSWRHHYTAARRSHLRS